jgi:hypothetical protein
MQHSGLVEVVHKWLVTERLFQALESQDRLSNPAAVRAVLPGKRRIALKAKFFAKERVPARLGRQPSAVPTRFARGLNGVEDAPISRTSAQMPVERLRNCLPIVSLVALDE